MHERQPPWTPKRLLKDLSRGVFYREGGGWTEDPESARAFQNIKELLQFCEQEGLRDAEVVEYFGRELPEPDSSGEAQRGNAG